MTTSTLAYPIGDRLYLNVTDRCTLVCSFCPKHNGTRQVHEHDLTLANFPTVEELVDAVGDPRPWQEVVFCGYGEPTLRLKVVLAVAEIIKSQGGRVRLNTDGLACLVHKKDVLPDMAGRIDALSVSLNAQNEETYIRHCLPTLPDSYAAVLDFLARAPAFVPDVTATAIDGLAGVDIPACQALAARLGVKFRTRYLDVVG